MRQFQLIAADGHVLGPVELGRPDWPDGSIIYTGSGKPNLRVVDRLDNDDDPEVFAALVVEPVPGCDVDRETR